ncbi:acetoin utilization protein AcuC [Algirhabdus cladophorae]|uniref:acetoin utilization protein AcuC n=1 Tax=Algirhabdus cladophorae TaxID=3377108 RepID=UPI003B847B47
MTPKPLFIGANIYRASSYGPGHPLRIPRVSTVIDLSRSLGWLPPQSYVTSPMAKRVALEIWHDPEYLAALQQAEIDGSVSDDVRAKFGLGTPSNPVFAEMYRRPATSAGGSLLAGELLRTVKTIYHPAGGTHHGFPARANGFCYLNDPVLAILALRRAGHRRIAYVDLDAHYPDGVVHWFASDPEVLLVSAHQQDLWPRLGDLTEHGQGNIVNIPVPPGYNDTEAGAICEGVILPAVQSFGPDALVVQCGADALLEDPQSRLELSNLSYLEALRGLMPLSEHRLVLGGGGYNPWSVGRAWTAIWGLLSGQPAPVRLPAAAEAVLRGIEWSGNSRAKNPPEYLFTTLLDTPRRGPVRPQITEAIAYHQGRRTEL